MKGQPIINLTINYPPCCLIVSSENTRDGNTVIYTDISVGYMARGVSNGETVEEARSAFAATTSRLLMETMAVRKVLS